MTTTNLREVAHQKEFLSHFGYKENEYALVSIETYADQMNDGQYISEGKQEWLIPSYTAKHVRSVYIDFTMTNITFYDKDDKGLFSTVGEGYSDIVTPLAFQLPLVYSGHLKEQQEGLTYITFTPQVKDPVHIDEKLEIQCEEHDHHGDLIDYNQLVPFNEIPKKVLEDIDKHYQYSKLTEHKFDEFKDELICRLSLNIGLNEERGYEVHCNTYYFYRLNSSEEPYFVEAQGEFAQKWISSVSDHLAQLGWNPEIKIKNKQA
ncbi:hypothetical protein QTG56_24195 (plasmid) [Rossellomorea sp. AcN35-11]|nr:hypothetical protein [Rossellomorea aquimaris]WJV31741.1 hypothetical protein QTG56_24195 [Rossellomorea sp. AcN35-11]